MADELADLEKQIADASKAADERIAASTSTLTDDARALKRARLEEELAHQLRRGEPDSASDEVVLPGREVPKAKPATPSPMASTTTAAPKAAATEEGN